MGATLKGPFGPIPLGTSVITVGRSPDNQLALQDPQASSHHAEIRPEGPGYSIIDRGSTNGTFINEQRIAPQMPRTLNAGDRIRIGSTVFTYEMDGPGAFAATVAADSFPGQDMAGGAAYANYGQWPSQPGLQNGSPQNSPYSPPAPAYAQPSAPAYPQAPGFANYQQAPAYPQQPDNYAQAPGYPPQPGFANYQQPPAYPQAPGFSNYGQAPGYPPQPGFPPPVPQMRQPPKKSNTGLIIGGAVLGVLVVALLGILLLHGHGNTTSNSSNTGNTQHTVTTPAATPTPVSTPQQTLTTYCNAIKAGDYNTAYNQFSSVQQSKETEQQYAANVAKATSQAGQPTDCTFSNIQTNGSTGTATVNLTFSKVATPVSEKIALIQENGIWKMNGAAAQQPQQTTQS